jgi:glycine cleavage system H protein
VEVNPGLEAEPELVNSDPYGTGWLIKISVSDNDNGNAELLDLDAYKALIGA